MNSTITLKFNHDNGGFTIIKKQFNMPDGLFSDPPSILIKLTEKTSLKKKLRVEHYDADKREVFLFPWPSLDIEKYTSLDDEEEFFAQLKTNDWIVVEKNKTPTSSIPSKIDKIKKKNRSSFNLKTKIWFWCFAFLLFGSAGIIIGLFLLSPENWTSGNTIAEFQPATRIIISCVLLIFGGGMGWGLSEIYRIKTNIHNPATK